MSKVRLRPGRIFRLEIDPVSHYRILKLVSRHPHKKGGVRGWIERAVAFAHENPDLVASEVPEQVRKSEARSLFLELTPETFKVITTGVTRILDAGKPSTYSGFIRRAIALGLRHGVV